jgi:DNA-binding protein HU-beta
MTKQEMIDGVLDKCNFKEGALVTKANTLTIIDGMFRYAALQIKKTGEFRVSDFGIFKLKARKARTGRNPHTGEAIKIKASKTVGFRPAKALKDSL